jgi:flagellar FliJ protein
VKQFRFPLAGLEKVRQAREDQARLALARSEAAQRAEEDHIMRLEQEMVHTAKASAREGVLNVDELVAEERYLGELRRQRTEALVRLEQWIGAVEQDRQRLLQARKERKALERLRERRYLEFVQEVLREEGQLTDEAGSVAHERNKNAA